MMKKLLLLFIAVLPMSTMAQNRYCATYTDYAAGNWKQIDVPAVLKSSSKRDPLAFVVKTDDKQMQYVLRRCFCIEYLDTLYLNLRPFNRFGDVYVQAWRMSDKRLVFARPLMESPYGLTITPGVRKPVRVGNPLKSPGRLRDMVCYVVGWNEQREELLLGGLMQEQGADVVLDNLLKAGTIQEQNQEEGKK